MDFYPHLGLGWKCVNDPGPMSSFNSGNTHSLCISQVILQWSTASWHSCCRVQGPLCPRTKDHPIELHKQPSVAFSTNLVFCLVWFGFDAAQCNKPQKDQPLRINWINYCPFAHSEKKDKTIFKAVWRPWISIPVFWISMGCKPQTIWVEFLNCWLKNKHMFEVWVQTV